MKHWTKKEKRTLRAHYPKGGALACVDRLPGRSRLAIYHQAQTVLGLKAPTRTSNPAQLYTTTPEIDAAITAVYQGEPKRGQVNALAKRLKLPRWWLSKQAARLCLVAPRLKEPAWTDTELAIAIKHRHRHVRTILRHLAEAGHKRTESGIINQLKRAGGRGRKFDSENYSATSLAGRFRIDGHCVTGWVQKGWLRSRRRGTRRTKRQGGDEHRIHRADVRQFVIEHPEAVDFRKVDKFWVVEILTAQGA